MGRDVRKEKRVGGRERQGRTEDGGDGKGEEEGEEEGRKGRGRR